MALSDNKITELKTSLENYGRLPEEDSNTDLVKAAIETVQEITDTELQDNDLTSKDVLAINRDFQHRMNEKAFKSFTMSLLAHRFNHSRFIKNETE